MVRCGAADKPHLRRQQPETDEAVPRIELDFADLGRKDQVLPIPSLKAVDVGSESLSATLCPTKAFSENLVETILAFVKALGHIVVMLHSDQEPVLVQLLKAVQSRRVKRTLVRHGPRARHQSQGKIENANRVINGVCRTMWLSLEKSPTRKTTKRQHLDSVVDSTRSMVPHQISSEKTDGRTAFVRVLGESVHEAVRRKSDVQVHIRANRQSGPEMGPWNLGWQGANDRRTHYFHGKIRSRKRDRCIACHLKKDS